MSGGRGLTTRRILELIRSRRRGVTVTKREEGTNEEEVEIVNGWSARVQRKNGHPKRRRSLKRRKRMLNVYYAIAI